MSDSSPPIVYQLKVVLQGISPMIWRRLLVKNESKIKDLHYIIQIAMGWEDIHLHYFTIHGQQYGVSKPGGMNFNTDANVINLSNSPVMGVWRYWWRHQIRVEAILPTKLNQTYPFCTGGKGICPPEDCGGAWGFMKFQDEFSLLDVLDFVTSILEDENAEIDREEAAKLQTWLLVYQNKFDRQLVNERLEQYMLGNRESIFEQEIL